MKKNTAQLTDSAQIANNPVISSEKYLQQYGIQKSYLTYHNFGSKIVEYLEIGMPYMIMYESWIPKPVGPFPLNLRKTVKTISILLSMNWRSLVSGLYILMISMN